LCYDSYASRSWKGWTADSEMTIILKSKIFSNFEFSKIGSAISGLQFPRYKNSV
jgi:hypothetical protein